MTVWGATVLIGSLPIFAMLLSQEMTLYCVLLVLLTGLATIGVRPDWRRAVAVRLDPFAICVFVCFGYAAITAMWSLDAGQSLVRLFRIGALIVLGYIAVRCASRFAAHGIVPAKVMAAGVLLLFVFVVIELFTGFLTVTVWRDASPIERENLLNRPSMLLGLMVWPALYVCWKQGLRRSLVVLGLLVPITLFFTSGLGPFVAAGLSCVVWLIASVRARLAAWFVAGSFVLATITMPLLALNVPLINRGLAFFASVDFFSAAHRLAIWNFAATTIREKPLLGWGLDSARAIPYGKLPLASVPILSRDLNLHYATLPSLPSSPALPLHPHNAGLQLILETGIVGAALFCLLILFGALRLTRDENPSRTPFALASLTTWLVVTELNIGIWQSWWLASGIVAIMFYFISPQPTERSKKEVNIPKTVFAAL